MNKTLLQKSARIIVAVCAAVKANETVLIVTDYAFEMASSNIRFGKGASREVGMDLAEMRVRRVMVLTDAHLSQPCDQAVPPAGDRVRSAQGFQGRNGLLVKKGTRLGNADNDPSVKWFAQNFNHV